MVTFLLNCPFVQGSIIPNEIFRLNDEIYETSTFFVKRDVENESSQDFPFLHFTVTGSLIALCNYDNYESNFPVPVPNPDPRIVKRSDGAMLLSVLVSMCWVQAALYL